MAATGIASPTVIAAILGAFATYIAQIVLSRRKRKREVDNFRQSLIAELVQMKNQREIIESVMNEGELSIEALLLLSTSKYPYFESNQQKLNLLTVEEQITLVRFYQRHEHFRLISEKMFDQSIEEEGISGMVGLVAYLEKFEEDRNEALQELQENL